MHQYRKEQKSLIPGAVASISHVSPPKHEVNLPPTRFKVHHSAYERSVPSKTFTVETEYQRYTSAELSSPEMDILRFWEVSSSLKLHYNTAHSCIGQQDGLPDALLHRYGLSSDPGYICTL